MSSVYELGNIEVDKKTFLLQRIYRSNGVAKEHVLTLAYFLRIYLHSPRGLEFLEVASLCHLYEGIVAFSSTRITPQEQPSLGILKHVSSVPVRLNHRTRCGEISKVRVCLFQHSSFPPHHIIGKKT